MSKGNYATGQQTRKKILKVSRTLFYKYGYQETTYDDISVAAGVNRALIPYYFKSKYDLGKEIFSQIYEEFEEKFSKKMEFENYSQVMQTNLTTFAFYRLLQNPRFCRLAAEIMCNEKHFARLVKSERKFILDYVEDEPKLSETELEILARMDYGIEKEIVGIAAEHNGKVDTDAICKMELQLILQYCGYPMEKIEEMVTETLKILESVTFRVGSGFRLHIKAAR